MKCCAWFLSLPLSIAVLILKGTLCTAQAQPGEGAKAQAQQAQSSTIARIGSASAPARAAAASSARPVIKPVTLATGTTLVAEFSGSLNARKLKPGDKVKVVLAQDLIAGGKIVAKTGSKLVGHVTEVKACSPQDPESRLGVVFDKILLKHHNELPLQAVVQALAPPVLRPSLVDEPDQMMPPMFGATRSSVNSGRSSNATALASSVTTVEPVTTVQNTPGNSVSSVRVAASANRPMTGGTGVHGIYGLKNLMLSPSTTDANPGPVIVSTKSDVKLESGTQVVLLVVNK